jgi:DNA polymerase III subunit beta
MPAVVHEHGVAVLPKVAVDLVAGMAAENVTIDTQHGCAKVRCGGSKATLTLLDAEDFPPVPSLDKENLHVWSLPGADLALALGQVGFCASHEEARPALTAIHFQLTPDDLEIAATDGFRLAVKKVSLEAGPARSHQFLLPAIGLVRLAAILKETSGRILVNSSKSSQVIFATDRWMYFSQTIDGHFPDFRAVIPASHRYRLALDTHGFGQALRQADVIARANGHAVLLATETTEVAPSLKILSGTPEVGSSHTTLTAHGDLPKEGLSVNSIFLRQITDVIRSQQLEIGSTSYRAPITVSPSGMNSLTYVVMPIWQEQITSVAKPAEESEASIP